MFFKEEISVVMIDKLMAGLFICMFFVIFRKILFWVKNNFVCFFRIVSSIFKCLRLKLVVEC